MKTFRSAVLLATVTFATASAVAAPYSVLEAFRATVQKINSMQGLKYTRVALLVNSTIPTVSPTSIVLTVHAKTGDRELHAGPNGVLNLKSDPALTSEDPEVTINQPKGTINIRIQPFVRAPIALASTLDVVAEMSAEYERVRSNVSLLERTYRLPAKFVRIVPEHGDTISATTDCGITFLLSPSGASLQTPMARFPKGCALTVTGHADRIELVFAQ
jgi:hypothetical protein